MLREMFRELVRDWNSFRIHFFVHNKIYWLSFIIGILSGCASLILKNLIQFFKVFLMGDFGTEKYLMFILPLAGIIITVFIVRFFIKDDLGHGVTLVLSAISNKKGKIRTHHTISSVITSAITIGFGGSVGSEAPAVITGSAIGSKIARMFNLNYYDTLILLGCGATGAISGIFMAPIAGIVFTLEVLMLDLTMASLIPILISSITAAVLTSFFMGNAVLLQFHTVNLFDYSNIPFYLILGVFSGFVSLYFTRMSMWLESEIKAIKSQWNKIIFGGLFLGFLIFLFPSLWGEGYSSIIDIFNGNGISLLNNSLFSSISSPWLFSFFLLMLIFFKVIAMTVTCASGGVGGIFAPSLFVGAITGYLVAFLSNHLFGTNLPVDNFALAGMGAMMAGVMHAPLLGIFLSAEITGGYQLFFPLMISSLFSYITIVQFETHSIYTKRLAIKGELITHHKDNAVLHFMKVGGLIDTNFQIVPPEATLGDLTKIITKSKRDLFPVVDDNGILKGMLKMTDIRDIIFRHELYDKVFVKDIMYMPEYYISPHDSMSEVVAKFETSNHYNLAVIDDGKYVGFISRARVFSFYRKEMRNISHD